MYCYFYEHPERENVPVTYAHVTLDDEKKHMRIYYTQTWADEHSNSLIFYRWKDAVRQKKKIKGTTTLRNHGYTVERKGHGKCPKSILENLFEKHAIGYVWADMPDELPCDYDICIKRGRLIDFVIFIAYENLHKLDLHLKPLAVFTSDPDKETPHESLRFFPIEYFAPKKKSASCSTRSSTDHPPAPSPPAEQSTRP